jgi:CubicO group peptidase (beta-lactamase class C family)
MKTPTALRFVICVLAIVSAAVPAPAQSEVPPDLDEFAARVLKEFEVPGLAIAIVKDGKVLVAKGYGVRKLGEPTPVDADTLFGIGSNTKAFTTAALAMLVDDGKLSWDDPVLKHLPSFQMYDPYVTREMTIRDLLTHRAGLGLGAGDLMFFPPSSYSREEIVQRLRFIKPATSFRSAYAYDNLLYLVAGEVVQAVSGKTWDDFVKERIFTPLGMKTSNTSVKAFRPGDDVATPHSRVEGRVFPIEPACIDNNAPAGAINSSVAEMAKWMIVQLNGGEIANGKRLFTARQSKEMWSAQTILPVNDPPPMLAGLKTNFAAYGLGWGLSEFYGHKLVAHSGGLPGYVSRVALIPDLKLGVVVLTNQESGGAFSAMAYHVLDHFVGAPATDWVSAFQTLTKQAESRAAAADKAAKGARAADSKPSLDLSKYAGEYRDAWYGSISIAIENGKLVMRFSHSPALVGDMEHWQYDTFIARWRDRSLNADAYVTFSLKPDGKIDQVKMEAVSPLTDFSFDFQDLLLKPAATANKP